MRSTVGHVPGLHEERRPADDGLEEREQHQEDAEHHTEEQHQCHRTRSQTAIAEHADVEQWVDLTAFPHDRAASTGDTGPDADGPAALFGGKLDVMTDRVTGMLMAAPTPARTRAAIVISTEPANAPMGLETTNNATPDINTGFRPQRSPVAPIDDPEIVANTLIGPLAASCMVDNVDDLHAMGDYVVDRLIDSYR